MPRKASRPHIRSVGLPPSLRSVARHEPAHPRARDPAHRNKHTSIRTPHTHRSQNQLPKEQRSPHSQWPPTTKMNTQKTPNTYIGDGVTRHTPGRVSSSCTVGRRRSVGRSVDVVVVDRRAEAIPSGVCVDPPASVDRRPSIHGPRAAASIDRRASAVDPRATRSRDQ